MNEYKNRQPQYYDEFRCLGGTCANNCCCDWGYIIWTDAEYDRLMNAEMSDELHEKLGTAFKRTLNPAAQKEMWNINEVLDEKTGKMTCPLLTEAGWCPIHGELGPEYLSDTCMSYPRINCWSYGIMTQSCSGSCTEILRMLLNDRNAMKLDDHTQKADDKKITFTALDSPAEVSKKPFLQYRNLIMELFYSLISDESYSPETGLVFGTIAAKRLSELVESGECDKIPAEIKMLKENLGRGTQAEQIENIQPNYEIKLGVMSEVFLTVADGYKAQKVIWNLADEENRLVVAKYEQAVRELSGLIGERTWFFRNLYLNTLLEFNTRYFGRVDSVLDFWLYYCACCSMLGLTATASALETDDPEQTMLVMLASFYRHIAHFSGTVDDVLKILREHNCTKPAYIALMLK